MFEPILSQSTLSDNQAKLTRRSALIVDLVSQADRIWFEDHPEASEYTRIYVPGEAGVDINAVATVVKQVKPGFRVREFILLAEALNDAP